MRRHLALSLLSSMLRAVKAMYVLLVVRTQAHHPRKRRRHWTQTLQNWTQTAFKNVLCLCAAHRGGKPMGETCFAVAVSANPESRCGDRDRDRHALCASGRARTEMAVLLLTATVLLALPELTSV